MADDNKSSGRTTGPHFIGDGYQPLQKGYQPISVAPKQTDQAGHQPTTGQGGSGAGTPPAQGGSGKTK